MSETSIRSDLAEQAKPVGFVLTNNSANPEKSATHVPFFGDRDLHDEYIRKGYIPMKVSGQHIGDRGDLGYFIPIKVPVPFIRSNKKATK